MPSPTPAGVPGDVRPADPVDVAVNAWKSAMLLAMCSSAVCHRVFEVVVEPQDLAVSRFERAVIPPIGALQLFDESVDHHRARVEHVAS